MNLTEATIGRIGPEARERIVWDEALRGFGLRVQPTGAMSFVVQYRTEGGRRGRSRKVTIGRYGSPWTVDAARKKARQLLSMAELGHDPADERRQARQAISVAELCELYFAEGCSTKKASTKRIDQARSERHIKPLLGHLPARGVTRGDVERFLRDVAAGRTAADVKTGKRGRAIVRGGQGAATRTTGLLGAIFTFAVSRGIRPDNPVRGVKRYPDKKGQRFLTPEETLALGLALEANEETKPKAVAIIRLLALTGARKSEISRLTWDEVDLRDRCLRLRDTKTGARTMPIGRSALALLASLKPVNASGYVFTGTAAGAPWGGLERAWRAIRGEAGLEGLRLHDLRHSFASGGAAAGHGLAAIGSILGHADATTTNRYVHVASSVASATADQISGSIASLVA